MNSCSKFFVFSVLLCLSLSISIKGIGAKDEAAVISDLAEAEETVFSAYDVVLEAEDAGANVSDLLVRLNVASDFLTEAYTWYRLQNFENSSYFAGLCRFLSRQDYL